MSGRALSSVATPSSRPNATTKRAAELSQAASDTVRNVQTLGRPGTSLTDVALLWGQYQSLGVPPSSNIVNSVLTAYSSLGCHSLAVAVYLSVSFKHRIRLKGATQAMLMASCKHAATPIEMATVMDRLESVGHKLRRRDLETFAVVCLNKDDVQRANATLRRLEGMDGELSETVYFALFTAALREHDPAKAAVALQRFFTQSNGEGAQRTPRGTFRVPLGTLLQQSISQNQCKSAQTGLVATRELGLRLNNGLLVSTLLMASQHGDGELADMVLERMSAMKQPILARHYSSRVFAHCRGGDLLAATRGVQDMSRLGLSPDIGTRRELALAVNRLWKDAIATNPSALIDMSGFLPDGMVPIETINCVLMVYGWNGYYVPARQLLDAMPMAYGIHPNVESYAALLSACRHPRHIRVSAALDIAKEMTAKNVALDSECYSNLAICLLRSPDHTPDQAFQMVEAAAAQGTPVNRDAYERFVRAYARSGSPDAVDKASVHMEANGFRVTAALKEYIARHLPK